MKHFQILGKHDGISDFKFWSLEMMELDRSIQITK